MNALTWLLQRISAAVLVIVLGIHVWALYVLNTGVINFTEAKARLLSAPYVTLYALLLSFGLFHALNGVYTVMVDMGLKTRKTTIGILLALGTALFGIGLYSVVQFIM
ncbi:MAG: succinate dehydrogenase [Bacillota bacterium]